MGEHLRFVDLLAVDVGAVGAVEVLQDQVVIVKGEFDLRMVAGSSIVMDYDVNIRAAPEDIFPFL